jgi:chloramphenicol-sensitive protein RarD
MWGLMPLYFGQIPHVGALEILANRVVWSALLLVVVLAFLHRGGRLVTALTHPRTLLLLLASTIFIAINWFAYILSVVTGRTLQSALGYYILPLFNVLLGVVCFGERLRRWQWAALVLAAGGLGYLFLSVNEFPWITFALAISFTFYGVLRKVAPVDAVTGLTAETLLLFPLAAATLLFFWSQGTLVLTRADNLTTSLLLLSGVVTTLPLVCFGMAARILPLTVLGLIQYLSPTLQFLIAVLFLREEFSPSRQVCFACTWAALLIFTIEGLVHARREASATPEKIVPSLETDLTPSAALEASQART